MVKGGGLLLLHLSCVTALQIASSTPDTTPSGTPTGKMASSDAEAVQIELLPFIRVYRSGRVERLLGTATVPASLDAATGVASRDVTVDPATGVSVRLYLPPAANSGGGKKLPVLVYFHGGGFMVESAASPTYHGYLNALASRAGVLAVSVEYRRAPEHPLPAAYDDSWAALAWAVSGCEPSRDPWLSAHGDASRVFLAGDSAGANIAHNVAARVAAQGLGLPTPGAAAIVGLLLVHPYFWDGSNAMGPELEARIRAEWRFTWARPEAQVDDPRLCPTCSPPGPGATPRLAALPCERVMVAVAGDDFLAAKGRAYHAALRASGWRGEAELADTPGQGHVFHLLRPWTEAAAEMLDRVAAFIDRA